MSFRNTDFINNDSNSARPSKKAQQSRCGTLRTINPSVLERTVEKIASAVVDLHQGYLSKCANLEIFRDLSQEEQGLLDEIQNNNSLHTALTGILAIDSCVKTLQREENRVMQSLSSNLMEVLQNFKNLESEICKFDQHFNLSSYCQRLSEGLKELIHLIFALPAAKCRQHQSDKFLIMLQQSQLKPQPNDKMNKETDGENQRLRRMLQQKQAQINRLQFKQRIPRLERLEDRKTYNIGFRTSRQRSTTQNDSNSPGEFKKAYGQISMLKQQLKEKNIIIDKMNEQFASEMDKYNSVFKRIQQQNRLLKKYIDIDTVFLLEQLEMEIQALRQEKRKDQFIISDIQRKIEGISMSRTSRVNTRTPYEYQRQIPSEYPSQQYPSYETFMYREGPQNKFYSPNLVPSRHSPYNRQITREQAPFQSYPFKERPKHVLPIGKKPIQGQFTRKSRSKQILTGRQGRQTGQSQIGTPNLFERVMLRR